MTEASHKLWYKRPAKNWVESLLLGNGRFGAALFGSPKKETVFLNLDTLWSGYPRESTVKSENPYGTFCEARRLSLNGENAKAQALIEKEFTGPDSQNYLPLGKLIVSSKSKLCPREYRRSLDISQAVHSTSYRIKKTDISTEAFISAPADVMVMRYDANGGEKLNLSFTFQCELRHSVTTDGAFLRLEGICPSEIDNDGNDFYYDGDKKGISFCCLAAFDTDGQVKFNKNNVSVECATHLTVYIGADDSFVSWDKAPDKEYTAPCEEKIKAALKRDYNELKSEHIADYRSYYTRVSLDLGDSKKSGTVTSARLREFLHSKNDPELYTLLFNFGRYLAISSSRPDTQAMTLQGIWTYKKLSPWRSNYTVNINTEMNYWPLLMCSLPELCRPLNDMIKDLSLAGKKTAKELYHARGFTSHHNIDVWRHTVPVPGSASWSFWYMSGAWFTRHLFEYYEYTGDTEFLKETAYPIILDSARFCLDMLTEDKDGKLIACPSTSPENIYYDSDGKKTAVSQTTTMTMSIIKDNFDNALRCAEILGDSNETTDEIKAAVPRLLEFRTGKDGRLLEWYDEVKETEIHHRHVSHLYALFPSELIDVDKTPELAKAAEKTLDVRGDNGTGWSLGWKINFRARLRQGDRALKLLDNQLRFIPNPEVRGRGGTYPNMLDAHPPFQIDGNFGAVSGIAQMFVQSFGNRVLILPALPQKWQSGRVTGLTVKGSAKVDIEWKDSKPVNVTANGKGTYIFVFKDKEITAELDGETKIEF